MDLFAKMRIWKENYVKSYPVHRLVAEAFLDNPENKPYVDHIVQFLVIIF